MTATFSARPDRQKGLARRARAVLTRLSDRVHAAGDARTQMAGWTITRVPGPLGLDGRAYRDPRFAARRTTATATTRRGAA